MAQSWSHTFGVPFSPVHSPSLAISMGRLRIDSHSTPHSFSSWQIDCVSPCSLLGSLIACPCPTCVMPLVRWQMLHRKRMHDVEAQTPSVQQFLETLRSMKSFYYTPPGANDDWCGGNFGCASLARRKPTNRRAGLADAQLETGKRQKDKKICKKNKTKNKTGAWSGVRLV